MCLSWQNRGRQRKSGGRTVCAPAQVRGKTANHRLAKLKAPGAKWEQRTDQNDAEHERQRREALVSAKALPRRSNFRKSPLGGPRIRGTGGKRTAGLRRNACGAVVPPGAVPTPSVASRHLPLTGGVVPRRLFGSFLDAQKGTRPAGRNPLEHPAAEVGRAKPAPTQGGGSTVGPAGA